MYVLRIAHLRIALHVANPDALYVANPEVGKREVHQDPHLLLPCIMPLKQGNVRDIFQSILIGLLCIHPDQRLTASSRVGEPQSPILVKWRKRIL